MPRSSTSVRRASRVCVERVRLPVGAVEGEHLLRAEPFPQRVLAHEQSSARREPARGGRARGRNRSGPSARPAAARPAAPPRARRATRAGRSASVGPRQSASASWNSSDAAFGLARGSAVAGVREQSLHARRVERLRARARADSRPPTVTIGSWTVARERLAQLRDVDVDGLLARSAAAIPPRARRSGASRETNSFACSSSDGEHDSLLQPSRAAIGRPSSSTSSGPRIRNSTCRFYRIKAGLEAPRRRSQAPHLSPVLIGVLTGGRPPSRRWHADPHHHRRNRRLPRRGVD